MAWTPRSNHLRRGERTPGSQRQQSVGSRFVSTKPITPGRPRKTFDMLRQAVPVTSDRRRSPVGSRRGRCGAENRAELVVLNNWVMDNTCKQRLGGEFSEVPAPMDRLRVCHLCGHTFGVES